MIVRSFRRIIALTLNTLTDLTRQRVFYFALVFALVLIGSSVLMARFTFQQEFQILKMFRSEPCLSSRRFSP